MTVATEGYVLELLRRGVKLREISDLTCWPVRQIYVLAGRWGLLFTVDGTPYSPPRRGDRLKR
jgi:hypothetical protein